MPNSVPNLTIQTFIDSKILKTFVRQRHKITPSLDGITLARLTHD